MRAVVPSGPTDIGRLEMELLLLAAAPRSDGARAAAIEALARAPLDWALLRRLGEHHRLLPLLHRRLSAHCPALPPAAFTDGVRRQCLVQAARGARLAATLAQVVTKLQSHGLTPLAYRGPTLAAAAYPSTSDRWFDDLDLLLPPEQMDRAVRALQADGYELYPPPRRPGALRSHPGHGRTLRHAASDTWVDLDSEVGLDEAGPALSFADLSGARRDVPLDGTDIPTLAPEALVLALCVHGTRHAWSRLCWVADLAWLLHRSGGLDLRAVGLRARRRGLGRATALGLDLAHGLAEIPEAAAAAGDFTRRDVRDRLRRRVEKTFAPPGRRTDPGPIVAFGFQWSVRERAGDRFRLALFRAVVPTRRDWRFLPLPERLRFLYYLVRPLRIGLALPARLARLLGAGRESPELSRPRAASRERTQR